jgi:spore germination protein
VQIDFESVAGDDAAAFLGFLKELKKRLPGDKILSVALPARRKNIGDAYSYRDISAVADRIMIMAYDQHWSGSVPGPVASLSWCRDVLDYASKAVPREKLIMGLPLYGRSWQDRSYSRALFPSHVDEIIKNENAVTEYSIDRGASLSYEKTVRVKIYYEDTRSIVEKLSLYSSAVRSVAFWRLGMENGDLWSMISLH